MPNLSAISRTLARNAERHMVDECSIVLPGKPTFDDETGLYSDPEPASIYEGRCTVRPSQGLSQRVVESGGKLVTLKVYDVILPRAAVGVAEGQAVDITASTDPALVGVRMWVREAIFATEPTTRRVIAEYQHTAQEGEEGS